MMLVFDALTNYPKDEKALIQELLKTGKYSEEAKSYIKTSSDPRYD
jgi:hypothetical protein